MRNAGFKILYLITALVVIIELVFAVKGSLFTDINELPVGTRVNEKPISSPTGENAINIYLVKNNLGVAIRGEILNGEGAHNIFWQTGIDTVEVEWLDDNTVMINEIPINTTFGYDCRRGYSLFDDGSLEENFTDFNG